MNETVQQCARIVENPYAWLAESKQQNGRRVIGCFPMYVPHEIVDAAGMTPVDVYGGSGDMTAAAAYLQNITCYPVRSAFELLLTDQLGALDGAILATVCAGSTSGGEMWRSFGKMPYYHQFVVPHKADSSAALDYCKYQVQRLQSSLEAFGGRAISQDALAQSIKLYNQSRSLLGQLAAVSRQSPDALPPREFGLVRAAASFMPRAEYTALLSKLLSQVAGAPASGERARLVLGGSICDLPQFAILSLIHQAGGVVVEDDSTHGRRMQLPVAEDGDPIEALARHYVDGVPCPTKLHATLDANFEYLLGLAKSSQAQGIVFLRPLYCDQAGIDYPMLSQRLNAAGVPTLALDLNGREAASGQVLVRLQAFVEMLRS